FYGLGNLEEKAREFSKDMANSQPTSSRKPKQYLLRTYPDGFQVKDMKLSEAGFNGILHSRLSHPGTHIIAPKKLDLQEKGFAPALAWYEQTVVRTGGIGTMGNSYELWASSE
ncbi:9040_t:CDS:2, partial [Acaulospora colombiana]